MVATLEPHVRDSSVVSWAKCLMIVLLGVIALNACATSDGATSRNVESTVGASSVDLSSLPYRQRSIEFARVCLAERGWEGTIDPADGGLVITVPEAQRAAYDSDHAECEAQFLKEFPPPVLTEADFRDLYRQELETMECLKREGYPPRTQPVSEQAYVDAYLADEPLPWFAYEAYDGSGLDEIEQKCPQPSVDGQ